MLGHGFMSEPVIRLALNLLQEAEGLSTDATALAAAALAGDSTLEMCIANVPGAAAPAAPESSADSATSSGEAFIGRISLTGFRGVASRLDVELRPAPGLVVVTGRNGSGKSSIAEAAEVALSGGSLRAASPWWSEGLSNLHHDAGPEVQIALRLDGGDDVVITSVVTDGRLPAQRAAIVTSSGTDYDLAAHGWDDAVAKYRPILTYTELSELASAKPSELFDAIHNIVGLDSLAAADKLLTQAVTEHSRLPKEAETQRKQLLADLKASADPRARELEPTLKPSTLNLDAARAILTGDAGVSAERRAALKQWIDLRPLAVEPVQGCIDDLVVAIERDRLAGASSAGRAKQLVEILERVVKHREHDDDLCPVCGEGVLDSAWLTATQTQITDARRESTEAEQAGAALRAARAAARHLLVPIPPALAQGAVDGVDPADVRAAWKQLVELNDPGADPAATDQVLVAKLADAVSLVAAAVTELKSTAELALANQDTDWAPIGEQATATIAALTAAAAATVKVRALTDAREWIRTLTDNLRAQRVQEFRDQATAIWTDLRQDSNVTFDNVTLEGVNTRRHVGLTLTVDGTPGSRAVLSQGELAALGLALFLPRSTAPQSPFRFVLVDDPVQSMDPSKVDGLAHVLHTLGKDRQVIVFTHDDRLLSSLRRLSLPATAYVVERQAQSKVAVRLMTDAVDQYLRDADALAKDTTLPADLLAVAVAGHCRDAVEEVAAELAHARLLAEGKSVAVADTTVRRSQTKTRDLLALALLGDARKNGAPLDRKLDELSETARDTVKACVESVHEPDQEKTAALVGRTSDLLSAMRSATA